VKLRPREIFVNSGRSFEALTFQVVALWSTNEALTDALLVIVGAALRG